jgi:hypothetical protein
MSDDIKALKEKVAALEKALEMSSSKSGMADITPEDIKSFQKVRDVFAFDPDNVCGINECFKCINVCRTCTTVCVTCRVCRICRVCDFECVCGPCSMGGGRGGRFGDLGE